MSKGNPCREHLGCAELHAAPESLREPFVACTDCRGFSRPEDSDLVTDRSGREALDRLRSAVTEQEALQATAALIDAVVDGGVAVAEGAAQVATALIGDLEIRGDFRVCSLWVLYEIGRCVGVWSTADRGTETPNVHAGVERETRAALVLATGQQAYVNLMSDREPDVRSLAYLLTGLCARDPARAARLLADHERGEKHVLARACARQAVLVAVARVDAEDRMPAFIELLRAYVRCGTSEDRGRMRRVVEGHSGVGLSVAARQVLGDAATGLIHPEGPFWPIEHL